MQKPKWIHLNPSNRLNPSTLAGRGCHLFVIILC